MTFVGNNKCGRARQLNLNEVYYERISFQPLIQSSQQTSGLEQSENFPHTIDIESKNQLGEDVGIDVIGKYAHVFPN